MSKHDGRNDDGIDPLVALIEERAAFMRAATAAIDDDTRNIALDRVAELDERIAGTPPTTIAGAVAALALVESEAETHGTSPLIVPLLRGVRAFLG